MVVLVTGSQGQLGETLQFISKDFPEIQFHFFSSLTLDITNKKQIEIIFKKVKPDFCINAAAYTAVDKAESDYNKAYLVNVEGVKKLAQICNSLDVTLVHISTDFVFDGNKKHPYKEDDHTNPQGVYGKSKRDGELEIEKNIKKYFIIRTSWLYSEFGNNFMKTMLRLSKERKSLSVVNDQIGTPTYTFDLANTLVKIILSQSHNYGIYHYSNEGSCSWYDFAKKIFEVNMVKMDLISIPTSDFPTPATRPKYSVLDKEKIKKEFNILIRSWEEAIKKETF